MAVSSYPAMCMFQPAMVEECPNDKDTNSDSQSSDENSISDSDAISDESNVLIRVTHTEPSGSHLTIVIPLIPEINTLQPIPINLHNSASIALRMPSRYSDWFSARFGFPVVLVYSPPNHPRAVLGNIAPNAATRNRAYHEKLRKIATVERSTQSWCGNIANALSAASSLFQTNTNDKCPESAKEEARPYELAFADCSPYLIVTSASFNDVAARLPPPHSSTLEIEKFRPNIIIGAEDDSELPAWDEDYWAELTVNKRRIGGDEAFKADSTNPEVTLQLTANCIRCTSLNVDFATGKFGTGPKGQVLKTLQADRRIDAGKKFGPVFGRYGFLPFDRCQSASSISVGDRLKVTKRNEKRTVWRWPGSGITKKDDVYPDVDVFT